MGHFAWRSANAGIDENQALVGHEFGPLATYLNEGITWRRLQSLAVQSVANGGFGLFQEGSRAFKDVFAKAPCTILDGRPEVVKDFLEWLVPREEVLAQLVAKDVQDRGLAQDAQRTAVILNDKSFRVQRVIAYELLHRALYPYYCIKRHGYITSSTSFADLIQRTVDQIMNLTSTDDCLLRLRVSAIELIGSKRLGGQKLGRGRYAEIF